MLRNFIERLSRDFGYKEPLAPNDQGTYSLRLESDLDIILSEVSESCISFYSFLCPLPEKKIAEFLLYAMDANLFGRETGGSSLGIDKSSKKVTLLYFLTGRSSYREFHDALEDFVNYVEAWKQEIIDYSMKSSKN